ncbi:MAG TPA: alpha/beta hydrolase [Chitinophagaceae bacterium]|nr:alpha/beta hydrolase [Chitinophagaceae bacterium]
MEHHLLPYQNSFISYYRFGNGPKKVICFHGYGEEAASFQFFEKHAGKQFSFYSIELPFHGKTQWNNGLTFTKEDLINIVNAIAVTDETVVLIGFSLGGRIVLSLFEEIPGKVEKIILMAPDGLKVNFWYWLSTQTVIGNRLFAFTMNHPSWFFGLLKFFNRLKLVNASILKFVRHYIDNKEVRHLLYKRWTSLRKIKPHLEKIKSLIKENNTPVRLIYGKHDRIILTSVGEKFRKGIEGHCTIDIIHSGHQVLHEKHINELLPALFN